MFVFAEAEEGAVAEAEAEAAELTADPPAANRMPMSELLGGTIVAAVTAVDVGVWPGGKTLRIPFKT